ncbi:hypothetical protein E6Q11_04340 [Candidatus Dojkabacteria bacterium]|uniref:Uncharacterized protein n=1 Tax=Candidatus Dojkabacteria bacterium TaxID=2099670 RepID=A0A5C7J511_9BACT|nr:MAG: hypothetical protein E6Q11_04340 [Candidatus Dojkabacteria bacterium]
MNLNDPIFTKNPFEIYLANNINAEEWGEIWYRKKFLEYKLEELVEYIHVIQHKSITRKQLARFLARYELYLRTQSLIKRNEQTIHISYYPENLKSFIKDYYHGKQDKVL